MKPPPAKNCTGCGKFIEEQGPDACFYCTFGEVIQDDEPDETVDSDQAAIDPDTRMPTGVERLMSFVYSEAKHDGPAVLSPMGVPIPITHAQLETLKHPGTPPTTILVPVGLNKHLDLICFGRQEEQNVWLIYKDGSIHRGLITGGRKDDKEEEM